MEKDLQANIDLFELKSQKSQDSNIFAVNRLLECIKDFTYKISIKLFAYEYSEEAKNQLIWIHFSTLVENMNLLSLL